MVITLDQQRELENVDSRRFTGFAQRDKKDG